VDLLPDMPVALHSSQSVTNNNQNSRSDPIKSPAKVVVLSKRERKEKLARLRAMADADKDADDALSEALHQPVQVKAATHVDENVGTIARVVSTAEIVRSNQVEGTGDPATLNDRKPSRDESNAIGGSEESRSNGTTLMTKSPQVEHLDEDDDEVPPDSGTGLLPSDGVEAEAEEAEMAAAAAMQEQGEIQDHRDLPCVWPAPLVEDFNDTNQWPAIHQPGDSVSSSALDWVMARQEILLRVVTWNLCAEKPPSEDSTLRTLLPRNRFHVVVVGSEECERSIAMSALNPSKAVWEQYLTNILGESYVPLRSHTLQAIHIMAFAHRSISHLCSDVSSVAIPTGMGNTLGNKGGVVVTLKVGSTKIAVANAHLAAHQNAVKQRNDDFHKISTGAAQQLSKKLMSSMKGSSVDDVGAASSLSACADRVIFMGDLNYRIRGTRSIVDKCLALNMHDVLLSNDQLKWSMQTGKVLTNFIGEPSRLHKIAA
jgi:hypothetical protein